MEGPPPRHPPVYVTAGVYPSTGGSKSVCKIKISPVVVFGFRTFSSSLPVFSIFGHFAWTAPTSWQGTVRCFTTYVWTENPLSPERFSWKIQVHPQRVQTHGPPVAVSESLLSSPATLSPVSGSPSCFFFPLVVSCFCGCCYRSQNRRKKSALLNSSACLSLDAFHTGNRDAYGTRGSRGHRRGAVTYASWWSLRNGASANCGRSSDAHHDARWCMCAVMYWCYWRYPSIFLVCLLFCRIGRRSHYGVFASSPPCPRKVGSSPGCLWWSRCWVSSRSYRRRNASQYYRPMNSLTACGCMARCLYHVSDSYLRHVVSCRCRRVCSVFRAGFRVFGSWRYHRLFPSCHRESSSSRCRSKCYFINHCQTSTANVR